MLCLRAGPEGGRRSAHFRGRRGGDIHEYLFEHGVSLAGADGRVCREYLWAALDCPGYFSLHTDRPPSLMLLGRFVARVDPVIHPGSTCIVIGWAMGSEGRKHFAGTALFSPAGDCVGSARATWIEIRR